MSGALLIGVACTRLQLAVEDLLAEKQKRVVLDLTAVPRVDSGGLGKIVNCLSRIRIAGGTMLLAGVNDTVVGLFKLTKVDRIVKLFPTAREAAQGIPRRSRPHPPRFGRPRLNEFARKSSRNNNDCRV